MAQLLIPRMFHRIWLGDAPLPNDFINFGKTWCQKHPNWKMKLWTDKNMIPLQNQKAYESAEHPTLKADIAKLEILHNLGGVYIDCDFECLKNIEPILNDVEIFAAKEAADIVSTAIFGCIPKNHILKMLIEDVPQALKYKKYDMIRYRLGQIYATEKLMNRDDIKIFSSELFYPYLYSEKNKKDKNFPDAYAIHHWAGSWL